MLRQKHELHIRTNSDLHGLPAKRSKTLNSQMERFRVYSLSKRFDNLSF